MGMVMAAQREMAELAGVRRRRPARRGPRRRPRRPCPGDAGPALQGGRRRRGAEPTAAGSAIKLLATELGFDLWQERARRDPAAMGGWFKSFGLRIGGGTSEIQRNIIGERVLALPREPRR